MAQPMPLASFPRIYIGGHTYPFSGIVALLKFVSKPFLVLCQLVLTFEFKAHDIIVPRVIKPGQRKKGLETRLIYMYTGSSRA